MNDATTPLRVPITTASRKGVSWLNEQSRDRRVVLTRFGRAGAVVDSADRLDGDLARLREAASAVVEGYADRTAGRTKTFSLGEVCTRLGVSEALVRARGTRLRAASDG